ncbi:hypothetical protein BFP97_06600 [Roseivirga sp. 4D4]|uniref:hypothetical protein n=1 Tax=Roseivirga sp. 4D4 TaxID=1889784 RepID=UPI000852EA63|nr:hypothetical protein [Roseivirga sp. 4D4]OEK01199.1 hypothetical protein BFP97_06600 [Roseivirga sp. 4D4]
MSNTTLYAVQTATASSDGQFSADQVDPAMVNNLPAGTSAVANYQLNGETYIVAFNATNSTATTFQAYDEKSGKYLIQVATQKIDFGCAIVEPFYMANSPMLICYDGTQSEYADFIQVADDFSLTSVYGAKIGEGNTTVKPFAWRYGLFFIAYNMNTGDVAKYQLSVPSSQALYSETVWTDGWAQGWTRFSFFQMGGENFFIKTNVKYNKVNVDHFMDGADEPSHPVLNIDAPDQMRGLTAVSAFTDAKGFPYFATYRDTGEMTFNGIYGSVLGWDVEATVTAEKGLSVLNTFIIKDQNYTLVC